MSKTTKSLSIVLGAAFATTLAASNIANAAETGANPFAMTDLSGGYQVAKEGKCGGNMSNPKDMKEGKCGGSMKKKEGKCGEGKCGGKKKMKKKDGKCGEGKCGASKKKGMKEGKCGGSKKNMKEGKCGG